MKYFVTAAAFIISLQVAFSQKDSLGSGHTLPLLVKNYGDSVVLRWAPENFTDWMELNRSGYSIFRVEFDDKIKAKDKPVKLNTDTIKPWPLEKWKQVFGPDHAFAPAVAQALFGAYFVTIDPNMNFGQMKQLSSEQQMRHGITVMFADFDPGIASASGLRYCDKNVVRGKSYLYLLSSNNKMLQIDTGFAFVSTSDKTVLPGIPAPSSVEEEKQVLLAWDNALLTNYYSGYWIDRKDEQSGKWETLNKLPVMQFSGEKGFGNKKVCMYSDTTANLLYKPYFYRLRGITAFGDISAPSETVKIILKDKTAPSSPEINQAKSKNNKMRVEWNYTDKKPADFAGFFVERAQSSEGPFEEMNKSPLPFSARHYDDDEYTETNHIFYRITAKDTIGNTSYSLTTFAYRIDSVPPAIPSGLNGRIDSLGRVYLSWNLGKEADIYGFRVYMANSPEHEFSGITQKPVRDTQYVDTIALKTLTRKVYYKITAVDVNFNHSQFSQMLVLTRPDIVKPVSPLMKDYAVTDTSVNLEFIESNSVDLAFHSIQRKELPNGNWQKIVDWKANEKRSTYVDRSIEGGKEYLYEIIATDSAGNQSLRAESLHIKVYKNPKAEKIQNVKATPATDWLSVTLTWDRPEKAVRYFIIYKSIEGGKIFPCGNAKAFENVFKDTIVKPGQKMVYYVQAVFDNGAESDLGESNGVTLISH